MAFSRQIAAVDVLPNMFPGYKVGNWYIPDGFSLLNAGVAPGANSIRFLPGFLKQKCTLDTLGVRISTGSAGNVQAAIYANSGANMRPTGSALVSTSSMSTASAVSVNAAASVQLDPGLYWFATNGDNASFVAISPSSASPIASAFLGSATQAIDLVATAGIIGLSAPQTFGTWGDVTAASFTEVQASSIPIVQFKVASVP